VFPLLCVFLDILLFVAKKKEKHRAGETHKEKTDKQVVNTKSKISRKTQSKGNTQREN
jgi:hypothetical protein